MTPKVMTIVGIDVAKDKFDAYSKHQHRTFNNTKAGFAQLVKWSGPDCHFVMEATGPYFLHLAHYLYAHGARVSVVNPLVIKRYAQTLQQRIKTDAADAKLLADYGMRMQPPAWTPPKPSSVQLRQLYQTRSLLLRQKVALGHQRHAYERMPDANKYVLNTLKTQMEQLTKQIKNLEIQLQQVAEREYPKLYECLKTIPGLGLQAIALLLSVTQGFERFDSSKQLASYMGISPAVIESGKIKVKSPAITKIGMSQMRQMLYLCALSASQYNPGCKQLYQRLKQKGKASKVALVAVAHKLLRQAFAVAKAEKPFNPKLYME